MISKDKLMKQIQEEKDYCWANAILNTVICFYKANGNRKLYEYYISEVNACHTSRTKMAITRRILESAGLEQAWFGSDDNLKKYFQAVFKNVFSTSFVNHSYKQACDRGALFTQAWRQNFICPYCGQLLDMNITDSKNDLFVEGDHITAVSKVGYKTEWMSDFYGKNYISVLAVHRQCNRNKYTNETLPPMLQDIKAVNTSDLIERIKML